MVGDYVGLGAGWGRGDRQPGCREKSETNGVMVGARGWQSAHCGLWPGQCPLGSGASGGMGLGRPPGVGGPALAGTRSLTLTPACLPGQRWHPGVSGAACWSGSSRTAGTNGAQARTARRTTSPSGPPTVSAHRCQDAVAHGVPGDSCPEGASLSSPRAFEDPGWAKRSKESGAWAPRLLLSHL